MGAAKGVVKTLNNPGSYLGTNYNDTITGSTGDDLLAGGNGDDVIRGSAGNDTLWGDSFSNSDANDNGQDRLYGDAGNDVLHGGNGKDYLNGGGDNDSLFGDNGIDVLFGDSGSDLLQGGQAGDYLKGGSGADTFKYTTNSLTQVADSAYLTGAPAAPVWAGETTVWAKSWDVISDFSGSTGEGDKIDLLQISSFAGHSLTFRAPIGSDAFAGSAHAGLAYGVWADATGTFLYADITGDGAADMKIQVSNVGEGDFVGVTIDHDGPVAALSITDDDLATDSDDDLCDDDLTALVTISFNEFVLTSDLSSDASKYFDITDLTAAHGTLSNLTTSDGGKTWTVTFTATDGYTGPGSVSVLAGGFVDYSNNAGVAAGPATIHIDTENPTAVIALAAGAASLLTDAAPTTTLTITFSEAVQGLTAADFSFDHGTVTNLAYNAGDGTYTLTVQAADGYDGTGTVTLAAASYTDECGNAGETASFSGLTIDRFEDSPPPATVARVEFVPGGTDPNHNGQAVGAIGQFLAYDAGGNLLANQFTAGFYGLNDKLSLAADGTLTFVSPLNNYDTTITLFGQAVHIQSGSGADNTFGATDPNAIQILFGFNGEDNLTGGTNGDSLFGGDTTGPAGHDTLIGGNGNDYLFGGDNSDWLTGGGGADHLSGGAGDDRFIFTSASDSLPSARDVISDFDSGDSIDLSALGLTSLSTSSLSAMGAYAYQSGGNTYLDADTDGNGVADFSIMLSGLHTLDASNVVL